MTQISPAQKIKKLLLESLRHKDTGELVGEAGVRDFTMHLAHKLSNELIMQDAIRAQLSNRKILTSKKMTVVKAAIKGYFSGKTVTENPYDKTDDNHDLWKSVWWYCKEESFDFKVGLLDAKSIDTIEPPLNNAPLKL